MVREALDVIKMSNTQLGMTILLVEQNVREALTIARPIYVLRMGKVVL